MRRTWSVVSNPTQLMPGYRIRNIAALLILLVGRCDQHGGTGEIPWGNRGLSRACFVFEDGKTAPISSTRLVGLH